MKPISIQLYTVRNETEGGRHLDVLRRIAEIGYVGVEGGPAYGMTGEEFRKVVEDLGMVISSTWVGIPGPGEVQACVDTAGTLGTDQLVAGLWVDDFADLDAIRKTADRLAFAVPALREHGITLSLHNHWIEFEPIADKLKVDYLVDYYPDVQLEVDVYWCTNFGANDPVEQVRRLRDRIPMMHVKDGPITRGEPMTAVGSGKLDIPGCLAAANPDVLKWLVVELDEYAGDMLEAVESSYRYLVGNGLALGRA